VNVIPFENLTDQDAFWGARIVLSFTKAELRKIIETAEYTDPRDAEYLLHTLLARQRAIAGYWLKRVSPLSDFAVKAVGDGLELRFRDLMAQHLKGDASVEYTYQIKGNRHASNKMASRTTAIKLSWDQLRAALGENPEANSAVDIIVWSKRQGSLTNPVRIRLENALSPATVRLAQIARLSSG
jgi:hypothetical protein